MNEPTVVAGRSFLATARKSFRADHWTIPRRCDTVQSRCRGTMLSVLAVGFAQTNLVAAKPMQDFVTVDLVRA